MSSTFSPNFAKSSFEYSPINLWITSTNKSSGNLTLPESSDRLSNWNSNSAIITSVKVQTDSTNWDMWICETDEFDTSHITSRQIASAQSGEQEFALSIVYNAQQRGVYVRVIDNSGSNTFDLHISGETREANRAIMKPNTYEIPDLNHWFMNGMTAMYMLNEGEGTTINDLSGNGYDGTLSASSFWSTYDRGNMIALDGLTNYGILPDGAAPSADFTFVAFARSRDTGTGYIYSTARSGGYRTLFGNCSSDNIGVYVVNTSASTYFSLVSKSASNTWHTYSGTLGTDNKLRFFRDGTLVGGVSNSVGTVATLTAGSVRFGMYSGAYFLGDIDYLYIYSRALSQEELHFLHRFPYCMFPGHQGYFLREWNA